MKRYILTLPLVLAQLMPFAFGGEVPLLQDLRQPVAPKTEITDEAPVMPAPVSPERVVSDLGRICPEGAIWYVSVPDATRMVGDWDLSPIGRFSKEKPVRQMFRNNRFGLGYLFSDIPDATVTPQRVGAVASAMELSSVIAKMSRKMAFASYLNEKGVFSFVFLFDVGTDRVPAFELMTEWETGFYLSFPGTEVMRGDHGGNFLDVWTLREPEKNPLLPAEVVAGFVENLAIVSNDQALAQSCMGLLNGGSSVATSQWGKRLAASIPSSASADAVAYLRMEALLEGLKEMPIARQSVASWADYIGHGGADGEAIYYGLQFAADSTRETFLLPSPGAASSSSLVELLAKRLRPVSKWTTVNVLPYQPNPALFLAAQMEGRQLGSLLRQEQRLFGLSSGNVQFQMPGSIRRLFTNEITNELTGELGLAFYPGQMSATAPAPAAGAAAPVIAPASPASSWILVVPCNTNPASLLPRAEREVERSGTVVYSREDEWRTKPSWAVISQDVFRRVNGHYLVMATEGDLVISAIDQLISGASFSSNRDFTNALAQTESGHGFIFYINLPEIIVRLYPNLSQLMRSVYPRSSGLNSRPPLTMIRRYSKGVLGTISPSDGDSPFTRVTIQSPAPLIGALAADIVLRFPMNLRSEGRVAMEKSRENMQALWLRLQLYSSRFGHFPENLEVLMSDMRITMPPDEVRSLFTAPAALTRLSPDDAAKGSYTYVAGATPNDEPDVPILYEASPWSEDFSGMYPTDPQRAPNETGDFQPYRQYIQLDGKIVTMPEKRFQERVLSRMLERE